jgi:hypothetical protein
MKFNFERTERNVNAWASKYQKNWSRAGASFLENGHTEEETIAKVHSTSGHVVRM